MAGREQNWMWMNSDMSDMVKRIAVLVLCLVSGAAQALDWDRLWLNDDQRAAARMEREDYAAAAQTFDDPRWRAAAWYRAGEYRRAAATWGQLDDTDAHYNRGNALARAGNPEAAMDAYQTVLQREPGHADARHNLEVLRELMQQRNDSEGAQRRQQDGERNADREQRDQSESESGDSGKEQTGGRSGGQATDRSQAQSDSGQTDRPEDRGSRRADQSGDESGSRPEQRAGQATDEGGEASAAQSGATDVDTAERQAAMEQWLRRIPDDPGGLLRRKFLYQYRGRSRGDEEVEEPW